MLRYLLILGLLFPVLSDAQNDRSLSPYFMVNVDSGESVPDFPLKSTQADVEIAGVIADVTVTQVYINHSARPLEAIYVFPGSTNAAVYGMEMQIGRRTITAKIAERTEARTQYNEAKQKGKTASLLEQDRPNIFTMNVANVMPGDSIVVRMSYTERLVPTDGVYEFVYPTVVGPRCTGRGAPTVTAQNGSVDPGIQNGIPYTGEGVKPSYDFGININIASGIPFEYIRSTSHKVLLSFTDKNAATVLLDPSETAGGNRDFILQYRFAGGKIETGLLLYEGKEENFFLLMMQPPKRVPVDSVPPREYIFVMDVSGSMNGYPIETSKKLLRNLVGGLRLTDKFNVVQFAGGASLLSPESIEATTANIDSAIAFISRPQGSGGTELNSAMRTAMFIPRQDGYSRSIVIVTDGLISAEASVLKSMRAHLDSANVFAFGIGNGVNRYLIEAMAYTGNGEPFVVAKAEEADSAAEKFRRYISSPVLTNIKVNYNGFDVYDNEPSSVPDLFADRPLVISGKYHGKASGTIYITGNTGAGPYSKQIKVDSVRARKQNKAIRLLWARDRVKYLSYLDNPGNNGGYSYGNTGDTSARSQITAIGLKYGILTNYTSFLAIDNRIRNKTDLVDSSVVQPLPLTEGMDSLAIGFFGFTSGVTIATDYSYGSIGYISVASCQLASDVSYCVILPARPIFPGNTMSTSEPVAVGDVNWYYNGGFTNPVVYDRNQPFFTPGASGRISAALPTSFISTYSFGNSVMDPSSLLIAPANAGVIALSTWRQNEKNRLTFSATQRGEQNLAYSNNHKFHERFESILDLNGRWMPFEVDRNEDGRADISTGLNVNAHHYFSYYSESDDSGHFSSATNQLYFHYSDLHGGQYENGNFPNADHALGFYANPKFQFQFGSENSLIVNSSYAIASLENSWGIDRFHLNTSILTAGARFDHWNSTLSYKFGVNGSISDGDERWNMIRLSAAHQSLNGYAQVDFDREIVDAVLCLSAMDDDVSGGVILPSAGINLRFDHFGTWIQGNRYRSAPFAMGQLLPLFNSSRQLQIAGSPGADQGWYFSTGVRYYQPKIWLLAAYDLMIPEHSVMIDMDADANLISVYDQANGPAIHRIRGVVECNITDNLAIKAQYIVNIFPEKHNGSEWQRPLTPLQKAFLSADWVNNRSNLFGIAQVCYTGIQRLPQHGWSDDYMTVNMLWRYKFRSQRLEVFLNAFNLLDYRQKNVVMSYDAAETQYDAWMIWAPVSGRSFQAGVTLKF